MHLITLRTVCSSCGRRRKEAAHKVDLTFLSIMRDLDKIISQIQEVSALTEEISAGTEEVSASLSLVYHSK